MASRGQKQRDVATTSAAAAVVAAQPVQDEADDLESTITISIAKLQVK